MKLILFLPALWLIALTSCAGLSSYEKTIESQSKKDKRYEGFYNRYEVGMTLLNSAVTPALYDRLGEQKKWDSRTRQQELEKAQQQMSSQTKVFVSLYTPDRQHNDLDKANSMWEIYLEAGGQRYKGKVKKNPLKLYEAKSLYPYHSRWSKGYDVTFNVPMTAIENEKVKVVLTSSLGTTDFEF